MGEQWDDRLRSILMDAFVFFAFVPGERPPKAIKKREATEETALSSANKSSELRRILIPLEYLSDSSSSSQSALQLKSSVQSAIIAMKFVIMARRKRECSIMKQYTVWMMMNKHSLSFDARLCSRCYLFSLIIHFFRTARMFSYQESWRHLLHHRQQGLTFYETSLLFLKLSLSRSLIKTQTRLPQKERQEF